MPENVDKLYDDALQLIISSRNPERPHLLKPSEGVTVQDAINKSREWTLLYDPTNHLQLHPRLTNGHEYGHEYGRGTLVYYISYLFPYVKFGVLEEYIKKCREHFSEPLEMVRLTTYLEKMIEILEMSK